MIYHLSDYSLLAGGRKSLKSALNNKWGNLRPDFQTICSVINRFDFNEVASPKAAFDLH